MDGIVLLTKTPGITSFSSLFNVKKALNTNKVGHTGTLDSFAQGLLVVCTGRYTRLVSNITEFNKSYKAVISFGKETDTLEYTGKTVKESALPSLEDLKKSVEKFRGNLLQAPPSFSAIHVNGKRASDLARKGNCVEIPKRKITVFDSKLLEVRCNSEGFVESCLIDFTVSKGTYIRALARDIANDCGSSGYLSGLYRTKVGNFCIEDSAGFSLLNEFNIENALKLENEYLMKEAEKQEMKKVPGQKYVETPADVLIKKEVCEKIKLLNEEIAIDCGFVPIHLKNDDVLFAFMNGKPIRKMYFNEYIDAIADLSICCVFTPEGKFAGLVKLENGKLSYNFVNN